MKKRNVFVVSSYCTTLFIFRYYLWYILATSKNYHFLFIVFSTLLLVLKNRFKWWLYYIRFATSYKSTTHKNFLKTHTHTHPHPPTHTHTQPHTHTHPPHTHTHIHTQTNKAKHKHKIKNKLFFSFLSFFKFEVSSRFQLLKHEKP